jgi:hypothetical protein
MTVVFEGLWRIPLAIAFILVIIAVIMCIIDPTMINKTIEYYIQWIQWYSNPANQDYLVIDLIILTLLFANLLGSCKETEVCG